MNTAPRGVPSSARARSEMLPRRDATVIIAVGRDAERREIERMQRRHRVRLDRVEHFGAARHAARVPVLELPPGDQHERILGCQVARPRESPLAGTNRPLPDRRRKILGEHDARSPGSPSCSHG